MYINNYPYNTSNISLLAEMRYLLFNTVYSNMDYIEDLKRIIGKYISVLNIDYSPETFSFTIKVKKTGMRRICRFRHTPEFYYAFIPSIFREFITLHKNDIISPKMLFKYNPSELLDYVLADNNVMVNLCNISCMFDNIVIIKL